MRAGWDGKMEVCTRDGEFASFPNFPVGEDKQVGNKKKLSRHIAGGRTAREVQVSPEITGCDRDMGENGRPFGKEGCRCAPSVIPGEYCTIPGLAFNLGTLLRCSMGACTRGMPLV